MWGTLAWRDLSMVDLHNRVWALLATDGADVLGRKTRQFENNSLVHACCKRDYVSFCSVSHLVAVVLPGFLVDCDQNDCGQNCFDEVDNDAATAPAGANPGDAG